jgi:hypothetical protein
LDSYQLFKPWAASLLRSVHRQIFVQQRADENVQSTAKKAGHFTEIIAPQNNKQQPGNIF